MQHCFGCGKCNLPLFRERNRGRIFCGVTCQKSIDASFWLDFKRLNKVTIGNTEQELDPGLVWELIKKSEMSLDQIAADFLDFQKTDDAKVQYRTLTKMLKWIDKNPTFLTNSTRNDAKHLFNRIVTGIILQKGMPITAVGRLIVDFISYLQNAEPQKYFDFAIQNGNVETVRLLLKNTRIIPDADDNSAILIAKNQWWKFQDKNPGPYIEIVTDLLKDERVAKTISPYYLDEFERYFKAEMFPQLFEAITNARKITTVKYYILKN